MFLLKSIFFCVFIKNYVLIDYVLANSEVILPYPSTNSNRPEIIQEKEDNEVNIDLFDNLTNNDAGDDHRLSDGRIVGGVEADISEYPHQLSLVYNGRHICGASLIDFRWVITAAHCTKGKNVDLMAIRAGSSLRNRGGQLVQVKHVHMHPLYSPVTIDYDIAVLELQTQVTIWSARPIVLPHEATVIPVGTNAFVTGWGAVSESGNLQRRLQAVSLPIITHQSCQTAYPTMNITPRMFCAGFLGQGGKDSCQGDSGGGLVVDRVLLGVVSWGYGCARPEYPGVYTNVPSLIRFVRSALWGESYV